MAEAIGLGASIIGIAGAGVSVVTALTKFSISYKESDNKIQELAARVSLTASILQAIGDTVKENESGFKKEAFMVTWKEVLHACKENYGKLNIAISKANKHESRSGSSKKLVSNWGRLKWALGGEAQMKDLESSLEKSAHQVMMMQQVIQLTAIKLLGKSGQTPTEAELEEKRELKSKMDWILEGLVKSGLINMDHDREASAIMKRDVQESESSKSSKRSRQLTEATNTSGNIRMVSMNVPEAPLENKTLRTQSSLSAEASAKVPIASEWSGTEASKPVSADIKPPRPIFEAYFIVPQSFAPDLRDGVFGSTDKSSDEYMCIALDTSLEHQSVKDVMLDAESWGSAVAQSKRMRASLSKIPQPAQKEIKWLLDLRSAHSLELDWDLLKLVTMRRAESEPEPYGTRRSFLGYLIVLRGQTITKTSDLELKEIMERTKRDLEELKREQQQAIQIVDAHWKEEIARHQLELQARRRQQEEERKQLRMNFRLTMHSEHEPETKSKTGYGKDVNRQKTRKWAQAKPANYGGDDWGDDYDYYGDTALQDELKGDPKKQDTKVEETTFAEDRERILDEFLATFAKV